VSGPRADDEEQLGATHTVTPAFAGGAVSGPVPTGPGVPVPGDVISGKYRIEECLGKGGMGMVFRATHLLSEKRVALKWMLRPASDPQATGRFVREARAAARIDHANVVDVYDVGEHGGFGYLVMELLRGESLWDRLGRGTLGITDAVNLVLPAMRGVAAAHAAGVIHRDLKPHNLFLCAGPDGAAREAKVLDFGISSFINADATDPTLTMEGTILGTPAYMSPEQLRSSVKLDPRTDVYSMGVILYEAVTGRVPFEEPSFTSLVLAIANTEPPPPSRLRPELAPELERVIMRAVARNRDERYQDMASFIAALEPFASHGHATGPHTAPGVPQPAIHAMELDLTLPSTPAPMPAPTLDLSPDPGRPRSSEEPVPPVAVAPRRRRAAPTPERRRQGLLAIGVIALVLGGWIARGGRSSDQVGATAPTAPRPEAIQVVPSEPVPAEIAQPATSPVAAPAPVIEPEPASATDTSPIAPVVDREPPARLGSAAPRRTPRSAKLAPTPAASVAPAATPEAAPRAPAGRSGTLSLDDML
jgi:serine/threonine-protein kinase